MSRLRVESGHAERLVEAFRDRIGLVDSADGFLDLEVWQSDRDAQEILMVSRWRDRDAFRAYMRSDAHRASHARIPDDLEAAIHMDRLEHLHTFDVVAR